MPSGIKRLVYRTESALCTLSLIPVDATPTGRTR